MDGGKSLGTVAVSLVVFGLVFLGTTMISSAPVGSKEAADEENLKAVFSANPEKKLGKKVVLVSGDEEYRSEEELTQLAKILSERHGFDAVVLYAVDRKSGEINPLTLDNIPGLSELRDADVLVLATRFRNLPDDSMKEIDDYLRRGGPILGIRTATHAFYIPLDRAYSYYSFNYQGGDRPEWKDGFGRRILGETWIDHHGCHGKEATAGVIVPERRNHPILRGVGPIFVPTDVYRVRLPLPDDSEPLLLGAVLSGMNRDDFPVKNEKNEPMMPIAWTKTYSLDGGPTGRVFTSTAGSGVDLTDENLRRLFVNATYWLAGLEEKIPEKADVRLVGDYRPNWFGFGNFKTGITPKEMKK